MAVKADIFYGVKNMNVTIESSGNLMIAYLIGELDHHSAGEVRSKIDAAVCSQKPNHLILDFKNISFMDSSGIGLVIAATALCKIITAAWKSEMSPRRRKK